MLASFLALVVLATTNQPLPGAAPSPSAAPRAPSRAAAAPAAAPAASPPATPPPASAQVPDAAPKPIRPLRYYDFEIDDAFWSAAQRVNRRQTLYHIWDMFEKTGRLANFRRAAGLEKGPHQGLVFNDSDVYKLAEGASYALRNGGDDFMELRLAELEKTIAAAQRPDGYLNTSYQLGDLSKRWTDLPNQHELYCLGHLIEAGVAGWESRGSRTLLDVGKRSANHIRSIFGPGRRTDVCGHPEIELALQRLYEVTGDPADRDLATWFLNQRGVSSGRPTAGEYAQDATPIREQSEVLGHAVRAGYLFAAAARLARESGDEPLAAAVRRLFADVTERKMYLTGGVGSSAANEGFTSAFDLPNDKAYAETCAAIALVLWAHEMHLLDRDARPIDVLERALYNAVRGGVSLDGTKFFYANPLASDGQTLRQPGFDCACCPPNILRILGRLGDFVASRDGETIFLNLYVQGTFGLSFGKASVSVSMRTAYPEDGAVKIWLVGSARRTYTLALRIPAWCEGATISVDGTPLRPDEYRLERGYAKITREWDGNNTVDLSLPMPVKAIPGDPRVEAQRGHFALQRGPLVYCVEAVDSAADLRSLRFDPKGPFEVLRRDDLLGGVTTITGVAQRPARDGRPAEPVPFAAIPFFAWANRDPGAMIVWLPEIGAAAP